MYPTTVANVIEPVYFKECRRAAIVDSSAAKKMSWAGVSRTTWR
jgi:hypothetical protein